jgi:lipopolysaccharide assembly outer membrane protein LptD (OstA)
MSLFKKLTYLLLVLIISIPAQAQQKERQDSLVRLMNGESAQLIEQFGRVFRKVIGHPATFLHNDTYLNCDTAMWDVDSHIINAIGHVQIIQNRTVLSSDKLDYFIDQNLAQFRGGVVQLQDKDRNTLRTRYLDFNTKDSVGIFQNGGVMKDKDGQIIESLNGTYDSKIKTFTFADNVNMYTDSIFVKTNRLVYESAKRLATFSNNTNAWKENNMLSANGGWYDRRERDFPFH